MSFTDLNSLNYILTQSFRDFENYAGFRRWMDQIPENLLRQFANISEQDFSGKRDEAEQTISIRLLNSMASYYKTEAFHMTEYIGSNIPTMHPSDEEIEEVDWTDSESVATFRENCRKRAEIQLKKYQEKIHLKLRAIDNIYSLQIFITLDLLLYLNPNRFRTTLESSKQAASRMRKEFSDIVLWNPTLIIDKDLLKKVFDLFDKLDDYTQKYKKEKIQHNRRKANLLLHRLGEKVDIYRQVVSFMGFDEPICPYGISTQ